jgi:hypothetical protein
MIDVPAIRASTGAVHVFPVRHHSPRTSGALEAFLDAVDPQVVLIEGPADATDLIEVLVDPETAPPVAILGYRSDGVPGSAMWPFASYSPEYVAARWARARGRRAEFVDLTIGQALAADAADIPERADHEAEGPEPETGAPEARSPEPREELGAAERVAADRGFRSFEEFWEASFEAPSYDPATFRTALLAWAEVVRTERSRPIDRARDALMAAKAQEVVEGGVPADRIALVVGAAHAAALVSGDVDEALIATIPTPVPAEHTLVPFSFPRLAGQLGYGAGNRAPLYYQRAHDAGVDYRRATLEVLVAFTDDLRLRGYAASLADTIEAFRLATMLATIRGKTEPGLDEVREAAIATLTRGDPVPVDGFLWTSVVGHAVGKVAARIGRNSLQEEFWREVQERRLPRTDEPERVILHLNNPVEVGTSIFLHRLRVGGIAYANHVGMRGGASGGAGTAGSEESGGAAALARPRETWEVQWTPATEASLVEAIVRGSTLVDVAADALDRALGEATGSGQAADIALEAVVAACGRTAGQALDATERLAAEDSDLPSLARAARALSGLATYGTSRAHGTFGDAAIKPLLAKVFLRAVLRVRDGATGNDEAVEPAKSAMRILHEVALSQPGVDREAWIVAARGLMESYAVNAGAAGLATGLLYLAREIDDAELALVVGQRLSNRLEPVEAASFLAGFLEVNATAIVRSRAVVAALDEYLARLEVDRFREALPVLRRAFSGLGASERRYLAENIIALRKVSADSATTILRQGDAETLRSMNQELSSLMDDLGDLL